jgi:CRISPR-associated protein Cas6
MSNTSDRVDLVFNLTGDLIPIDHAYALYGALARRLGDLHETHDVSIFPVLGHPRPDGLLRLHHRRGALRVRVGLSEIPRWLTLAGATLDLDGRQVEVGVSRIFPLEASARLASRLVTIKGFTEPDTFEAAVARKLAEAAVEATIVVTRRRVVRVRDDKIVGFGLQLHGLSPQAAIDIQRTGLGGRQKFGCGGFLPMRQPQRVV